MYDVEKDIQQIRQKLETKLEHHFLKKYIQKPIIEDEKIAVLYFLFKNYPTYEKENYIITVMLIEIALNSHDNVTDGPELDDHMPERKSKQLTVLAGDYYSGLYYLTLSELNDIKMTHTLATSIKLINEHKMKLYYHEYTSLNGWFELIKDINSLLIVHVAEYMGANELQSILKEWLLVNQLMTHNENHIPPLVEKWVYQTLSFHDVTILLREKTTALITNIINSTDSVPEEYSNLKLYILKNLDDIKEKRMNIFNMEEG